MDSLRGPRGAPRRARVRHVLLGRPTTGRFKRDCPSAADLGQKAVLGRTAVGYHCGAIHTPQYDRGARDIWVDQATALLLVDPPMRATAVRENPAITKATFSTRPPQAARSPCTQRGGSRTGCPSGHPASASSVSTGAPRASPTTPGDPWSWPFRPQHRLRPRRRRVPSLHRGAARHAAGDLRRHAPCSPGHPGRGQGKARIPAGARGPTSPCRQRLRAALDRLD